MPPASCDQEVPSKWMIAPACPTAYTSEAEKRATGVTCCVVGLPMRVHVPPWRRRIVPKSPTANRSPAHDW